MTRPPVADFVDSFFIDALFQPDDAKARSALTTVLAPDANIAINGSVVPVEVFLGVTNQFRATTSGKVISIKDLNIASTHPEGLTGVVAQFTEYEVTEKASGGSVKAQATTITAVEERDGKRVITGIWEVQSNVA